MKKIIYLTAFALIISACGKDDVNSTNNLIGTWELEYFYRDSENNQINFDNATMYERFDANYPPHTLTFTDVNECGLIEKFNNTDYQTHTYKINNNNINIEICESHLTGTPNHLLGHSIKYKISNNLLILAHVITIYMNGSYDIVIYGFYKRKL
jgi:hypothetical protein